MLRELDDPDLALVAHAAHAKTAGLELQTVVGVHAVAAVIPFGGLGHAIQPRRASARDQDDPLRLPDQRTGQLGDDEPRRVGARLSVVGVSVPEDVARELDDRVLEAPSGADQRDAALTRVANRREGAVHAAVRARRRDPDAVVRGQALFPISGGVGRHPREVEPDVLERRVREPVGGVRAIEVADDGDLRAVCGHVSLISARAYHRGTIKSGVAEPMVHVSAKALRLAVRWLTSQEAVVLLAALGIVLSLTVFAKTAGEMLEGDLREFDDGVLRLLRSADDPKVPIGPSSLVQAAIDVTAPGGTTVLALVLMIVIGYLALEHRYDAIVLVVVATGGGGLLNEGLKWWFARKRPEIVPHLVKVGSASFPSGHSMLALVTYLTLGALLARFMARRRSRTYCIAVSLLLALLVGLSRVYLGVHYPTDVLAGWSAGLAWALPCWLVARYLQYRGKVKPPA